METDGWNGADMMQEARSRRTEKLPEFREGKYRLLYDLTVREGPGLTTDRKKSYTPCGRIPGVLPAGIIVRMNEIKYLSVSVWGRCELGWVCIFMNETRYAARV